jgi:large subunit ribosomal protein L17
MAGGAMKYRHLGRKSSHRQALLRNLVTSLFEHESISTTWPKAKEAQRLAEKLITLGKRNTEAARRKAMGVFYVCHALSIGSLHVRTFIQLSISQCPFVVPNLWWT